MSRLPVPGSDQNQWGQILNDFLSVAHNPDGTLKQAGDIAAKYEKPVAGIPAIDLTAAVQASLASADTSVQSVNAKFPAGGNVTLNAEDVGAIANTQAGAASGVATLDGSSKLNTAQLPASVATKSSDALDTGKAIDAYTGSPLVVSSVVTKRATAVIGGSGGSTSSAGSIQEFVQRMLYVSPVKTTRWRMRLSNYSAYLESGSLGAGTNTLVAAHIGLDPDLTAGRWGGHFKTAPTTLAGATGVVPNTASDLVTPWVTDTALQLPRGKAVGFSIGITGTASTRLSYMPVSGGWGWYKAGSGQAAISANASMGTGVTTQLSIFDWRIEYEFESPEDADIPVVLAIGDSITEGFINNTTSSMALHHETWIGAAGLRNHFASVNLGVHSGTATTANSTLTFDTSIAANNWKYARADLTTTAPDKVIIALGTNDLAQTLAAYQASITNIVNWCRDTKGIPEVYLCTLIPRNVVGSETTRLNINAWIRSLPLGIQGILDMEKVFALQASSNPVTSDADLMFDYPHPTLAGYQAMASRINFR